MAARENQGLQIALIIFVILTIILIVSTYMFFSSYQKVNEANKALVADNTSKDTAARAANEESTALKNMIGAGATDKAAEAEARTKKDMEAYGKGIPEANRNYRFLVEHLGGELKTANTRIAELTGQNTSLAEKIKSDEAAKAAEIAKYKETLEKTAADLKAEREKFTQDRDTITNDKTELVKKFDSKRKEHEELTRKTSAQIAVLNEDKSKLRGTLDRINDEKLRTEKANEVPDGRVTWVSQAQRVVWINLGTGDGLRRQISFSVFDREDSNPREGTQKGKIEVVRLMQNHMSEARIIDDNVSNPIMPGDPIFSPTWEPGRAEHFALAGFMDIDGDGSDDRQRVRDLISMNGGVIDAETTEAGKTGKMTINTKYMVLGEQPKAGADGKTDAIAAYTEMYDEAKNYGVKTMPVGEFLNYMGYKPQERTVRMGRNANAADFKPRLPEGVQKKMPPNLLRSENTTRRTPARPTSP
jgi:hypothetical protein